MKTIKKPGILINRLPEDMQEDAIALRGYVGTLEARIAALGDCIHGYGDAIDKKDDRIAELEGELAYWKQHSQKLIWGYQPAIADVLAAVQGCYRGSTHVDMGPTVSIAAVEKAIENLLTTEGKGVTDDDRKWAAYEAKRLGYTTEGEGDARK